MPLSARAASLELDQWKSRRHRLLVAACAEAAQAGVDGLTLERVARRAGVSKGAVQYAFGSRDELLAALARYTLGGIFEGGVGSPQEHDPDLAGIVASISRGIATDEDRLRTVYSLMLASRRNPAIQRTLADFYAGMDARVEAALERSDDLPADRAESEALVRGVRGVVVGMFLHWIVHPQGRSREDVAAEIAIVLSRILRLPPGAGGRDVHAGEAA